MITILALSLIACIDPGAGFVGEEGQSSSDEGSSNSFTLITENYSGETITSLWACDYSEEECNEQLGRNNIQDDEVHELELEGGVWWFIWVDANSRCAYSDADEFLAGDDPNFEFLEGDLGGDWDDGDCD